MPKRAFHGMPHSGVPALPASVRDATSPRLLRTPLLGAGPEAVDDRELHSLLLSRPRSDTNANAMAASLLDIFATAPQLLAAHPERLRPVLGLSYDAIAAIRTAVTPESAWPGRASRKAERPGRPDRAAADALPEAARRAGSAIFPAVCQGP